MPKKICRRKLCQKTIYTSSLFLGFPNSSGCCFLYCWKTAWFFWFVFKQSIVFLQIFPFAWPLLITCARHKQLSSNPTLKVTIPISTILLPFENNRLKVIWKTLFRPSIILSEHKRVKIEHHTTEKTFIFMLWLTTSMAKKEPPYGYPLDASLNRGRVPHHQHHPGIGTKADPHPADDDDFDSR